MCPSLHASLTTSAASRLPPLYVRGKRQPSPGNPPVRDAGALGVLGCSLKEEAIELLVARRLEALVASPRVRSRQCLVAVCMVQSISAEQRWGPLRRPWRCAVWLSRETSNDALWATTRTPAARAAPTNAKNSPTSGAATKSSRRTVTGKANRPLKS